jgi:hypothetical protein
MELKNKENYDLYSFDLKETLIRIFESRQLEKFDYLNQENAKWLLYLLNSGVENEQMMEIFNRPHDPYSYRSENFIDDVVEKIDELLYGIKIKIRNFSQFKDEYMVYSKILDTLIYENQYNESKAANLEEIRVSYVQRKNEIFKKYHLKYKAKIGDSEFKSIYSESSQKKCIFIQKNEIQKIDIQILGKKKIPLVSKDFESIDTIEIPIVEVYTSIKPEHFLLFNPPPVYLGVNYEEKMEESNCDHHLELKFELKISEARKIQTIKKILDYFEQKIRRLEARIDKKEKNIKNLINPFENELGYDRQKGLFKKNEGNRCCHVYNCTLF